MTEADHLPSELLAGIAADHPTPLYVLDLDRLAANLAGLHRALAPDEVLFSLKTNYLPAVLEVVRESGSGVDVVSGYELRAALAAGFPGDRIVFNGPVKTAGELAAAVEAGVFVNIDGEEEIAALSAIAAGRELPVGLRVFPAEDVYAPEGERRRRRLPSKFGWPIEGGDADRMAGLIAAAPGLRLAGVHCHLGSQILNAQALLAAFDTVIDWVAASGFADQLTVLNLGGGFGVSGIHRHQGATAGLSQLHPVDGGPVQRRALNVGAVSAGVRELLRRRGLDRLRVCWEPGRAAVSDAVTLLTSVRGIKRTSLGSWAVLDGGLNLLPTAGLTEDHRITALRPAAEFASYRVGGPLCYEGDVFTLDARLPADLAVGELVAIEDAGAYSISRATSFNQPRAAVVAVRGTSHRLVWRAEQDADIFSFAQQVPAVTG